MFLLAHRWIGNPAAARVGMVAHGALGSGRNWVGFCRQLAPVVPDVKWLLVDLRGQGDSRGAPPPHDLAAAAADLRALARHLGIAPEVVIGHSLGGKVVLELGREPWPGLAQLWALDSRLAPTREGVAREEAEGREVLRVLDVLESLPGPFPSREAAVSQLRLARLPAPLADWLAMSLGAGSSGLTWKYEFQVVRGLLDSYARVDSWELIEAAAGPPAIHCLVAERSTAWDESAWTRGRQLEAEGKVKLHLLPRSGHWVHIDNPQGLLELLRTALTPPNCLEPPRTGLTQSA